MKALLILPAMFLALAPAFAEEAPKAANPVENCKSQAAFKYHFEMMKLEGDEMRGTLSYRDANKKKSERHEAYKEELEDCDDLAD